VVQNNMDGIKSYPPPYGANITMTLSNNIIQNNDRGVYIYSYYTTSSSYLSHNLIYNNLSSGLFLYDAYTMGSYCNYFTISVSSTNDTIAGNNYGLSYLSAYGTPCLSDRTFSIRNDIITYNTTNDVLSGVTAISGFTIQYTNVGDTLFGGSNQSVASQFWNTATYRGYNLQPTSPCIGAGDPGGVYFNLDGSTNDQGFTGGSSTAMGTTPAWTDLDHDGIPCQWEMYYLLDSMNPADADLDTDLDGIINRSEYYNGTDPTDPLSF